MVFQHVLRDVDRRQHARRVAGVDAGLFDVLHDAGNHNIFAVAECVNVNFSRRFQEVVDQHRTVLRVLDRLAHVLLD